jgi:hypothetical protein
MSLHRNPLDFEIHWSEIPDGPIQCMGEVGERPRG